MGIEELMKPRIKVIAPMPLMKNKVGHFLYRQEHNGEFNFGIVTGEYEHFFPLEDFKEWPYIFHICEWWEDRKVEDMPEYLESLEMFPHPHYAKVTKHYISFFEGSVDGHYWESVYYNYKPSTKEEYEKSLTHD